MKAAGILRPPRRSAGQCKEELRADTELAFDPDPALVCVDDPFRDRQPKASALVVSGARSPVAVKHERKVFGRNTWSRVRDRKEDVGTARLHTNRDARRADLDRIAGQIRQHLYDTVSVAYDSGNRTDDVHADLATLPGSDRLKRIDDV